jgi:hypothetical protein
LKNQISIITGDKDYAFAEEGISSIDNLLKKTSACINAWEKQPAHIRNGITGHI